MKKQILIISVLILSISGYSQGIEFEHATWAEVLEKAKQTNKPIFVDVYTSWCGPCKKMSNEVFPQPEVGKIYNANFVCYKIEAEKGEGVQIAKQYDVRSYPTYLFLKADGSLIMKATGSKPTKEFIALPVTVKDELVSTKPLSAWENEYSQKKRDPTFLMAYMNKRMQLGRSNTELLDEYLALLPENQRVSAEIEKIYERESRNIKINSLAYQNTQLSGYYEYMRNAIDNSFREATGTKNEQLLQQVIDENEKLPVNVKRKKKEELYINYYKRNDIDKYVSNATNYIETSFMTVSADSIAKMDKKELDDFNMKIEKNGVAKTAKSTTLANLRDYLAHKRHNEYSKALNEIAYGFFEKVTDGKALENALNWSKRSLEIYPGNLQYLDTYANLLYKLGRKEEAIIKETEALNIANNSKSDTTEYEEAIMKMKSGLQTWN